MRKRDRVILLHCDIIELFWVSSIRKYFVSLSVIETDRQTEVYFVRDYYAL